MLKCKQGPFLWDWKEFKEHCLAQAQRRKGHSSAYYRSKASCLQGIAVLPFFCILMSLCLHQGNGEGACWSSCPVSSPCQIPRSSNQFTKFWASHEWSPEHTRMSCAKDHEHFTNKPCTSCARSPEWYLANSSYSQWCWSHWLGDAHWQGIPVLKHLGSSTSRTTLLLEIPSFAECSYTYNNLTWILPPVEYN